MSAALSLTIATYLVVRIRLFDRPRSEWSPADYKVVIAGNIICMVCWIVIAVQALRAAWGLG
jgi:amino acid transporter